MTTLTQRVRRRRRPIRLAVLAAALGVAGCFTAAATFAEAPAQAATVEVR